MLNHPHLQFIGAYPKKNAMIFEMTLTLHMLLRKVEEGGLLGLPHKESQNVKANCFLGYQFVVNMFQLKSVTPVVKQNCLRAVILGQVWACRPSI